VSDRPETGLYDENVEPIDFDTDDDVVGITGFVAHGRRARDLRKAEPAP
jgi:hypothetical protein